MKADKLKRFICLHAIAALGCLAQNSTAQGTNARITAIELDNARPAEVQWRIDGQQQEPVKSFGIGAALVTPGAHELQADGPAGFSLKIQVLAVEGEHTIVPLATGRKFNLEKTRSVVASDLREEVTGRHIYTYDWGGEAGKPQVIETNLPFSLQLDSGLTGLNAFDSPRQPKKANEIFAKLYRRLPDKPCVEECLAATDHAANAYHGNTRVNAMETLGRHPISREISGAIVNALRKRLFVPEQLVDRLIKDGDADMIAGVDVAELANKPELIRLYAHFAPAVQVVALYRNADQDSFKLDILKAAAGEPWEKSAPIGQDALASTKAHVRRLGVDCLLHPELLRDAALQEKVKAALGTDSSWTRTRERYTELTSRAQATEATPAALAELRKTLEDANPKIAGAAAIQCVASDEPKALDVLLEIIPRMPEKSRRALLVHWRDNPFPFSPGRARVLTKLLASPEEFIYSMAAKQLMKKDYLSNPESQQALDMLTTTRPDKAGWQYDSICRDYEKTKTGR